MTILAIVDHLCYYCNGFPARLERLQALLMCFCKGKEIPAGSPEPEPADTHGPRPGQVETYSGYRLHEEPRHFTFRRERLEVTEVSARWQEPENLSFIVTASDSRRYLLKYFPNRDVWEVLIWGGPDPSPG